MERVAFLKMHGLGNDFVIVDARARALSLDPAAIRHVADRRFGVGCDQFLVLEAPRDGGDVFMRIYNPDGSESGACGNGTRCVARLLMDETGRGAVAIETLAGRLEAQAINDLVRVDMGPPRRVKLDSGQVAFVDMGNPHLVHFVADADQIDLAQIGQRLEHEHGANISFATIISPERIRLRVWERGAGATLACGTAACATLVSAASFGLTGRNAKIDLPGGTLDIEWSTDNHVWMTGPTETSFEGVLGAAA